MGEAIIDILDFLPDWLHVFVISMFPVIEVRGAVPYGMLFLDLSVWTVVLFAVLGNITPAPILLILGSKILDWMELSKYKFFNKIGTSIRSRSLKKKGNIEKYTYLGLMAFVAIPFPGTGVWTGCLIASLLGLSILKSFLSASAGSLIASIAMVIITQGGISIFS